jgi:hypothetical protein
MSELLGNVEQADDHIGMNLHVSEYTGPEGQPRLQLTSPFDIVHLDMAAARDLHAIMAEWLVRSRDVGAAADAGDDQPPLAQ